MAPVPSQANPTLPTITCSFSNTEATYHLWMEPAYESPDHREITAIRYDLTTISCLLGVPDASVRARAWVADAVAGCSASGARISGRSDSSSCRANSIPLTIWPASANGR